ncbi:hypothetical protein ABB37_00690 [Leptomonas pyrrhocoris]|uniref:BART domain-containing protein n=1 Tax=Leptomonas pyrrhocoris TaxID=157538 RepID=A0A0N0E0K4_LEPPY|nr:hypothetical protein ABB37_00690 [Leptomonas pyrrhocoris]KPA86552.1 hypothetical protein ABB37_00690 [Leptomonas pyrrhocoris]|eukprot:XP_015664991.1 hypothetical protein ABB37_00690 [Leptomonas pyrrhocoris]
MSEDKGLQGALNSFFGGLEEGEHSPLDYADDALLRDMDEFFSQGKNTERIRRFIEDNDETFALVATGGADDTDSRSGLQLYQLFQQYAEVIEEIAEDFVASREEKAADVLSSLVAAIQKEWNSSENAYRMLCTSYIAASLDYKSFLEFAEDLYGNTHYSMAHDNEDMESAESSCSGSGCGFEDVDKDEGNGAT